MGLSHKQKRKRFGRGEILQEALPPLASPLSSCLEDVKNSWKNKKNNIAALCNDWLKIAGQPLASNCQPLSIQRKVLVVGASHPQWLQALQYNRSQLLARIQAAGIDIKDLRIQQYHPPKIDIAKENELRVWSRHPSRIDIHGLAKCTKCSCPAPGGEITLWGMCSFCRRKFKLNNL